MPIAKAGDVNLEYYVEGSGPPLLMIKGFGSHASTWGEPFLERLRPHFTLVRFSNRGTGESDLLPEGATHSMMADDAAALLSALGIERAHVLGVSMGGRIAQELTLNYPERVHGLVLGCTSCGGSHGVGHAETMATLARAMRLPPEERVRAFWSLTVTPAFMDSGKEFLDALLSTYMEMPVPVETVARQLAANLAFDSYDRLPQIKTPTLIIHGDRDALSPVENAEVLRRRISGSRVKIIHGAGHSFFWEKPEESADVIVPFLSRIPVAA